MTSDRKRKARKHSGKKRKKRSKDELVILTDPSSDEQDNASAELQVFVCVNVCKRGLDVSFCPEARYRVASQN
jgi:hypothetical protein